MKQSCEMKNELFAVRQHAADAYARAVADFARQISVASRREYELLTQVAEMARKRSHEAQADLAEQQFDLTKVASRIAESSKRAAWGAFAAALASAVATVYGAVQRPSPPVCNPAVVQTPPPSPPPSVDVSVTLDGRRLPTKTEKRPRH